MSDNVSARGATLVSGNVPASGQAPIQGLALASDNVSARGAPLMTGNVRKEEEASPRQHKQLSRDRSLERALGLGNMSDVGSPQPPIRSQSRRAERKGRASQVATGGHELK